MSSGNEQVIQFEKVTAEHQKIIFEWLAQPHMQEFWDNSQEHKEDILNFINGRKQQYFYGTFHYWIGSIDRQPFCFLLTDEILPSQVEERPLHKRYLSHTGKTIAIDFYHNQVDPQADTFFIDPDDGNPRAQHVYEKAGFQFVGEFDMQEGAFEKQKTHLMILQL